MSIFSLFQHGRGLRWPPLLKTGRSSWPWPRRFVSKRARAAIPFVCVFLGGALAANAQDEVDIYGNLNSQANPPFNTASGWEITGPGFGSEFVYSFQFVPTVTAQVFSISVGIGEVDSVSFTANVALQADNNGSPGAILDSVETDVPPLGTYFAPSNLSVQQPILYAGTPYWITLQETTNNASIEWYANSAGTVVPAALNETGSTGGPWFAQTGGRTAGAFEVDGFTVPEPGSATLLCAAMPALLLRPRRKRRP